ncbi:MAG: hypothetical protein IPH45_08170 [Bacteroidales bacterium]|nr:hypothetical protein [Bacteroidales bacterium]
MRKITLLFILFFSISCSQKRLNREADNTTYTDSINKELAESLIESNFLEFADSSKYDFLKHKLINSFDIYDDNIFKLAHIDAEELAEFNFGFFIPALNTILKKRNFKLSVLLAEDYEITHNIIINGDKIRLYTDKDLKNETFWDTGSRNFFKKVNELIYNKGLNEKFYLLYEGNDLHAILLSQNQFKIIEQKYKSNKNDLPYLP